jgi:hypothetical protein
MMRAADPSHGKPVYHVYDSDAVRSAEEGSDSDDMFGGGTLRLAFSGGSLTNRSIRSWFMALALLSVNPGLRVPTTFDENAESRRVASRAWQWGHSVSSTLA